MHKNACRKVCNHENTEKRVPYILLGATLLLLLGLNIISRDHWLDSDMAAEMIFSRILAESIGSFRRRTGIIPRSSVCCIPS